MGWFFFFLQPRGTSMTLRGKNRMSQMPGNKEISKLEMSKR